VNSTISLAEAKAELSACIRSVEGGDDVIITRHGKPVVALVRVEDFDQLKRLRKLGPEGGLASLAGGWEGSEELVHNLDNSERVGQRTTPALD